LTTKLSPERRHGDIALICPYSEKLEKDSPTAKRKKDRCTHSEGEAGQPLQRKDGEGQPLQRKVGEGQPYSEKLEKDSPTAKRKKDIGQYEHIRKT